MGIFNIFKKKKVVVIPPKKDKVRYAVGVDKHRADDGFPTDPLTQIILMNSVAEDTGHHSTPSHDYGRDDSHNSYNDYSSSDDSYSSSDSSSYDSGSSDSGGDY